MGWCDVTTCSRHGWGRSLAWGDGACPRSARRRGGEAPVAAWARGGGHRCGLGGVRRHRRGEAHRGRERVGAWCGRGRGSSAEGDEVWTRLRWFIVDAVLGDRAKLDAVVAPPVVPTDVSWRGRRLKLSLRSGSVLIGRPGSTASWAAPRLRQRLRLGMLSGEMRGTARWSRGLRWRGNWWRIGKWLLAWRKRERDGGGG